MYVTKTLYIDINKEIYRNKSLQGNIFYGNIVLIMQHYKTPIRFRRNDSANVICHFLTLEIKFNYSSFLL